MAVSTVEGYVMATFELVYSWCQVQNVVKIPDKDELIKNGKKVLGRLVVAVVDGTEQRVWKSIHKQIEQGYFSGKKQLHTFTTLILCSPQGRIYYISPSYPGSNNDKSLFDMPENKKVFQRFAPNEWILGDLGFKGAYQTCSFMTPIEPTTENLTPTEEQLNSGIKSIRIVVENAIAALKVKWSVCSNLFRNRDPQFHHKVWYIDASLHNLFAVMPRVQ